MGDFGLAPDGRWSGLSPSVQCGLGSPFEKDSIFSSLAHPCTDVQRLNYDLQMSVTIAFFFFCGCFISTSPL